MVLGIDAGVPDTECVSMPADWAVPDQVHGDCLKIACDGAGKKKVVPDPEDGVDDGNPCTDDVCQGTELKHLPRKSVPCYSGPDGTEGVGECHGGEQQCNDEGKLVGACVGEVLPGTESCYTSGDEDCNGQVNEGGGGCSCNPGTSRDCYSGAAATLGMGACHGGMQQCNPDGLGFGACIGEVTPQPEHCDVAMVDEDCDGQNNEEGSDCVCGDGIVQPGEECDDGGTADGDACSPTCTEQRVLQIAAGAHHTCALLSGGTVKCWGNNNNGQLGLGDALHRGDEPGEMGKALPAVDLGTGQTATAIAAGTTHTCALLASKQVKCWGLNSVGQLGLGDTKTRGNEPEQMGESLPSVDLGAGVGPIAIACNGSRSCALLATGKIKCWGGNINGELGLGDTNDRGDQLGEMGDALPAIDLGSAQVAKQIALGGSFSCAMLQGGYVKCWGFGSLLGLGIADNKGDAPDEMGNNLWPLMLGNGWTVNDLFAGYGRTCSIRSSDSALKCWGGNPYGALGLGDINTRGDEPNEMGDELPVVDLGTGKTAQMIGMGNWHTCALIQDGTVKCWGGNNQAQLGLGASYLAINALGDEPNEMGDNLLVVNLGQGKKTTSISVGLAHTCALLDNGSIKCWGSNTAGKLGIGDQDARGGNPNEMGDNLPTVKLFSDQW